MSVERIGRYQIERELGQGGMAVVYLAHDPHFDRLVAVKVLSRNLLQDPAFRARFQREAKAIAALEHPAIVPVYDYGQHEEQPYLVMRYMPGGSLAERIRQGPLSLKQAAEIFTRLASALDIAHQRGMIHRDLKPGNILFDRWNAPYLSDFGIVKMTEGSAALTGSGIVGTPEYMSPEQARADKELDGRSDVYSLGVMLFYMLTGQLPYKANTPLGYVTAHINDPVPRIRAVKPDLPAGCDAIISRALAKSRDKRYRTVGDLARDVSQLAGIKPAAPARESAPRLESEPRPASPPIVVPHWPQAEALTPKVTPTLRPTPSPLRSAPRLARSWATAVVIGLGAAGLLVLGAGAIAVSRFINRPTAAPAAALVAATPTTASTRALAPTLTPSSTSTVTPIPFTPTPTLGIGSALVSDTDGMTLLFIPAGEFLMGSIDADSLAFRDERPQHTVYLDAFWIDRTEVTNAMFAMCVKAGKCNEPTGSHYRDVNHADHPAVYVDWLQAKDYCAWAGRRLPTEAEWEKAARGTDGRIYPWGNDAPYSNLLNYNGYVGDTTQVGKYPDGASPYGALDMAGNVWEWVVDWYSQIYYASSPSENPAGPSSEPYRVLRGGSWDVIVNVVRAAARRGLVPSRGYDDIGLRCSRSP